MKKASHADGFSTLIAPVPGNPVGGRDRTLWLWVAGGFLFVALMWAILFTAARSAKIESVPLAAQPGKP